MKVLTGLFVALGVVLATQTGVPAQQAPPPPQQPQQPAFRSKAELVRLDVSVLDELRVPVTGLAASDFTVLEDGKPLPLAAFAEVLVPEAVPPTTDWMRDVEPDIRRNDDLDERRLILIVMDDAQISSANPRIADNVRNAARVIIDNLGPSDLCAIIYTMDQRNMQEFTTDRTRLLAAIDRFQPSMTNNWDLFHRYSVGTLSRAAEILTEIPQRRKALFYISNGVPFDVTMVAPRRQDIRNQPDYDQAGTSAWIKQEMENVFRNAQLANVNIHAVDPGALDTLQPGFDPRRDFLVAVSENTGGYPIINRDDYDAAIARAFAENSSYYLLGYEPPTARDGRFHRIEVKVNRPGVMVRARSGYYAPKALPAIPNSRNAKKEPSPLVKAIQGLLPQGDLPLQVTAAPFAIAGKKESTVAIVLGIVQDVNTGPARHVEKIDFLVDAFGQDGSLKSAHGLKADVALKPNVVGKVGYEVLSRIDLKPGRYQLRLSAHLPASNVAGSIYYDIDVPDFSKGSVAMSGAMLSLAPNIIAAPRDKLADVLPIIPTTNRHFGSGDTVVAFVKLYQPGRADPKPVSLTTRITDSANAPVMNRVVTIQGVQFGQTRSFNWRAPIPIAGLRPGSYLLTFEATVDKTTVKRDVRFKIK